MNKLKLVVDPRVTPGTAREGRPSGGAGGDQLNSL
jgi:hypothetical protein